MFSSYDKAVAYLFEQLPMFTRTGGAALKLSLDNIQNICNALGNPQDAFKSIHIAGTNGKGTISHALASVYQEAGYKTALFTSPHFLRFTERMKINGEEATEQFVLDFINSTQALIGQFRPSFFEYTTAMAFYFFAEQKADVAIIETGLGGRLDSTNIIKPLASVIGSISLDHTQFLGNTVELVAAEKAGIIKKNTPVVSGFNTPSIQRVFSAKAIQEGSRLYFIDETLLEIPKKPLHFAQNITLALKTVDVLQDILAVTDVQKQMGISKIEANTSFIGRWQIIQEEPLLILDVGHNEDALKKNFSFLKNQVIGELHIVLGFSNDKDLTGFPSFLPKNAKYYTCQASMPRALDKTVLNNFFVDNALNSKQFDSVNEALNCARNSAKPNDAIYLGGSFFIVAEYLEKKNFKND